jgi:hypothetical protein
MSLRQGPEAEAGDDLPPGVIKMVGYIAIKRKLRLEIRWPGAMATKCFPGFS